MLKQFIFIFLFLLAQSIQISAQTQPPPISIQTQSSVAKLFFDKGVQLLKEQKFNEALDAFRQSARLDATQPSTQALSLIHI